MSWSSKKQATVVLSSTDAEYYAYSECRQEAMLTNMLLAELFGDVTAATIYEENMGAIFLVKNQPVGPRTKHIDTRHHFIREQYEKENVVPIYVKTDENYSDIMTKNLAEKQFNKFSVGLTTGRLLYDAEGRMLRVEPVSVASDGQTDTRTDGAHVRTDGEHGQTDKDDGTGWNRVRHRKASKKGGRNVRFRR